MMTMQLTDKSSFPSKKKVQNGALREREKTEKKKREKRGEKRRGEGKMFQDSLLDSSGKSLILTVNNPVLGISFPPLWEELRITRTKDA